MTVSLFDAIQTFYVDSASVNGSSEVVITSIDLYFRSVPKADKNKSGVLEPSVNLALCEVREGVPIPSKVLKGSGMVVDYNNIYPMSDASIPSIFRFPSPIKIKTNQFYGVAIKFDDPDFVLWTNKQGDKLVGTNTISPGSTNNRSGKYFVGSSDDAPLKAINDTDLKFDIKIAKFTSNTASAELVNKDYEFLSLDTISGEFLAGESVYKVTANGAGTVSVHEDDFVIEGTSTSFTNNQTGDYIVLFDGTDPVIRQIDLVVNTSVISVTEAIGFTNTAANYSTPPVGTVFFVDEDTNLLYLTGSSANSTNKFEANTNIVGEDSGTVARVLTVDDFQINRFLPMFDVSSPYIGDLKFDYSIGYSNGSQYIINSSLETMIFGQDNIITGYEALVRSRSNEVDSPYLYGSDRKSVLSRITMSVANSVSDGLYTSPIVDSDQIDLLAKQYTSTSVYTVTTGGVEYDTEVGNNGLAKAKHITSKMNFANNRFAEDLKVFMTAYRPKGTELRVYSKIHNSQDYESFDDKSWTPLVITENGNKFSSSTDKDDLVEYEFSLPDYSDTANTIPGTFVTTLSNNVVVSSGVDPSAHIANNDVIKIYNPIIPQNYQVAVAMSVNSTAVVLNEPVSNNNIVGSGLLIDKLKYPNIAFTNTLNDNIVRYFNSDLAVYDTFDVAQFKIVFLSDSPSLVPEVDIFQAIGVSA